ncbi:endonuclease/exonuclease/phosphatase family protein [Costertonia aggregata]|uniref:Endonuclease/exonuclease/phosphatase family protein n=1 Tax=Costertonia aggregata TaxID=343403 RepID=A0A7H9AKU1_9FLAO|nr:endonuclease/exonuclease/phosphatase family protein [Costertonia aggregata]QLG44086.1 endonuclease/exonuclease/phosphatase family protein [Costertonia aggregata]
MRNLSTFNKLVLTLNLFFSVSLLISFFAPHLSVTDYPFLSFFALSVPFLFLVNMLFSIYWLFFNIKFCLIAVLVLGIGFFVMEPFFKLDISKKIDDTAGLKIMGYNVQEFRYSRERSSRLMNFVASQAPDVIGIQEFSMEGTDEFEKNYPYSFRTVGGRAKSVQAIFSKYPIISKEHIKFPNTANSALAADIVYEGDTIRVYVVHLQSLRIRPGMVKRERSDHLYSRLIKSFAKQEEQCAILKNHMARSTYKTVICGDFNNTQYSHVYKTIKGDMQDTFLKKGSGFGRTINFWRFPLRIDFIFVDKSFQVKTHQNFDVGFSDHFPVMTTLNLVDQ